MQQTLPPPRELILAQLDRMLASDTFAGAERSRVLLKFLVEHALNDQAKRLKEYTIGSEALGRGDSFDPRTDPIVRAEASRLRGRLERYYTTDGAADTIVIALPKGSYVPQIQVRSVPEPVPVVSTAGAPQSKERPWQRFIWFALGGITVAVAVMILALRTRPEPPAIEFAGIVEMAGADYSPGSDFGNDVIISPRGDRIVFVALGSDHVSRLMTMELPLEQRKIDQLAGTEGARAPFFSPDGRWVGFWADAKVKKVSVDGGSPIELTAATDFSGASWGDGFIVAAIDGALRRVSDTSGESTVLADLRKQGLMPRWPHLLPGDTHVLFAAMGPQGPDGSVIELLSVNGGKRTPLSVRAGFARYLRDGYLVYVTQGDLFAVPFDPEQLTTRGTPALALKDRVAYNTVFGHAKFDVSRNGTLIYRRSPPLVVSWLERGGGTTPLLKKPGPYTFPRLSGNGEQLAINVTDSGVFRAEVFEHKLDRTVRLPFAPGSMSPVWHPKGFLVLGTWTGMSWMKADDTSKVEPLTKSTVVQIPWSFTPDGERLAYIEASRTTFLDLWTIPISHAAGKLSAGHPEPFLTTEYVESYPSFSPDGKWLAYAWGEHSKFDVYVRPYPLDGSQPIKVSQETGGRISRWLSNGRELVYRTDDHRLMVVGFEVKNGRFIPGKPTEWTMERLGDTGVISNFDVFDDRVLGLLPASKDEADRARTQAMVIPRFLEQVRARFSEGKK